MGIIQYSIADREYHLPISTHNFPKCALRILLNVGLQKLLIRFHVLNISDIAAKAQKVTKYSSQSPFTAR